MPFIGSKQAIKYYFSFYVFTGQVGPGNSNLKNRGLHDYNFRFFLKNKIVDYH